VKGDGDHKTTKTITTSASAAAVEKKPFKSHKNSTKH
jgi:hypothetical protein